MKDARRKRGIARRLTGAVFFAIAAAVSFAVVAPDDGAADFSEAAVIPDDAEVSWLDGWEFTNGTVSLFLSPSFPSPRLLIGAEATEAPLAGALTADDSVIGLTALAEEADGWYTNVLDVSHPDLAQVVVALANDQTTLSRVIAVPAGTAADETAAGSSAPSAGGTAAPPPLLAAPPASAPALVSGLVSEFYLASKNGGNYPGIPDFTQICPTFIKTDTTINFKSNGSWTGVPAAYKDYFATRHTGFIDIPADKTYTFYLQSDDGSMLYIDDQLVVNNGGLHGLREVSGAVYLAAGLHAIRVEYVEGSGTAQLVLRWSATGINKAVVPASAFCSYPYAGTIPPSVWLRSPAAGAIYKHLEPITLTAEALDLDGSVTSVSFYDGDELLATLSSAPYEFVWTNQAPREVHALTALAVDADGNTRRTPPLEVTTVVRPAGLDFGADISFYSFSQNPTNLPDFSALTPFATGVVERLSNPWTQAPWTSSTYSSQLRDRFGVVIEGFLNVLDDGRYSFCLTSDDGARLTIGDALIIDRDGLRTGDSTTSQYIDFRKGLHPFRVEYFQSTGGKSLSISWTDASGARDTLSGVSMMHVSTSVDSDGDGMPDWWERLNDLNPDNPSDAALDPDGDGLANVDEWLHRTNPQLADTDGDGMPDGWEIRFGLSPACASDAYGDADGDGAANIYEFLAGANPLVDDSDGDGVSDGDECLVYYSNPREADFSGAIVTNQMLLPRDVDVVTGNWRFNDISAELNGRSGGMFFTNDVCFATPGLFEVRQEVTFRGEFDSVLVCKVDGIVCGREMFGSSDDLTVRHVRFVLPWLAGGHHSLSLEFQNFGCDVEFSLSPIAICCRTGMSALADWTSARRAFSAVSCGTRVASKVSPYCVRGHASRPDLVEIDGGRAVRPLPHDGWYANIPLTPAEETAVSISYENGMKQEAVFVSWIRFNVMTECDVVVRAGDSMRLALSDVGSCEEGTLLLDGECLDIGEDGDVIHTFATAGEHEIVGQVGTVVHALSVRVVGCGDENIPVWRGRVNSLPLAGNGWGLMSVVCDRECLLTSFVPGATVSRCNVSVPYNGNPSSLAFTIPNPDASVVASVRLLPFSVCYAVDGCYYVAETLEDGTRVVESRFSAFDVSDELRLSMVSVSGICFEDGSSTRQFNSSNIDTCGDSIYRYLVPSGVSNPCQYLRLYYNGEIVVQ